MTNKQLNFNSVILLLIGAIMTFGIKKLDDINTSVIKATQRVDDLDRRLSRIESSVKQ